MLYTRAPPDVADCCRCGRGEVARKPRSHAFPVVHLQLVLRVAVATRKGLVATKKEGKGRDQADHQPEKDHACHLCQVRKGAAQIQEVHAKLKPQRAKKRARDERRRVANFATRQNAINHDARERNQPPLNCCREKNIQESKTPPKRALNNIQGSLAHLKRCQVCEVDLPQLLDRQVQRAPPAGGEGGEGGLHLCRPPIGKRGSIRSGGPASGRGILTQ